MCDRCNILTKCGDWQKDDGPGAPPPLSWKRKLNGDANSLKEFRVTFVEAVRMVIRQTPWLLNFAAICFSVPLAAFGSVLTSLLYCMVRLVWGCGYGLTTGQSVHRAE